MDIIGLGCGRSGTTYLTKILNLMGYDIGHEKYGKNGMVSSLHAGKKKRESFKKYTNPFTIHIVRDPLKVIHSMACIDLLPYRKGLDVYYNEFDNGKVKRPANNLDIRTRQIIAATNYWIDWNQMIENSFDIDLTIRVEDIPNGSKFKILCDSLSIDHKKVVGTVNGLGKNTNSKTEGMLKYIESDYPEMTTVFKIYELANIDSVLTTKFINYITTFGYCDSYKEA